MPGLMNNISTSRLSGIVEAVIQPHKKEGKALQVCITRPLILRYKVLKVSIKYLSLLSHSKPHREEFPAIKMGLGEERKQTTTKTHSGLPEITITSLFLPNK